MTIKQRVANMKLIKEEISDVQYLTEERDGKKSLYIVGPFLAAEVVNKNGRKYSMSSYGT